MIISVVIFGDGVIVRVYSEVTKSIPPYTVENGIPIIVLKVII